MRKFGLIGFPLGHSFSKKYFAEKFHNEHIGNCEYDIYPLTSIDLFSDLIANQPELIGLNVTIPYKSAVIKLLDSISPEAKEIGAVNVIKIRRNKKDISLSGFNSDVTGISDSLQPYINRNVTGAIVLGTGGSSKAVCYVLKKMGLKVTLVSRTTKEGSITYKDLTAGIFASNHLIVNSTPLGMFPDIDSRPDINYSLLTPDHILFDLVYNPENTSYLKMGAEQGCKTISGLKMLHSQAERSWEIWNNDGL